MKLTIIGTGYVGLVTGACFAEMGNTVTCVDVDSQKIANLRKGVLPIYEPGLEPVVREQLQAGRLHFATSLDDPAALNGTCFHRRWHAAWRGRFGRPAIRIGCGTRHRPAHRGLQHRRGQIHRAGRHGRQGSWPPSARNSASARSTSPFDVVSNPEFLKEGAAVEDFMKPDRVVIGTDSDKVRAVMHDLYAPVHAQPRAHLLHGRERGRDDQVRRQCHAGDQDFLHERDFKPVRRMGVDVESVRQGIGSDSRIGYSFIYPGAGFRRSPRSATNAPWCTWMMWFRQCCWLPRTPAPRADLYRYRRSGLFHPANLCCYLQGTGTLGAAMDHPYRPAAGSGKNGRCDRKDSRPALHLRFRGLE